MPCWLSFFLLAVCELASASLPRSSLTRFDCTALANRWGHVLDGYPDASGLGLRTNMTRNFGLTNTTAASTYDNIGQLKTFTGFEPTDAVRLNELSGYAYDLPHEIGLD